MITGRRCALGTLLQAREAGQVGFIGVTSHRRTLTTEIACSGAIDFLMIRYHTAHRGAEQDVFPHVRPEFLIVAYTGLRLGALVWPAPSDPLNATIPTYRLCSQIAMSAWR